MMTDFQGHSERTYIIYEFFKLPTEFASSLAISIPKSINFMRKQREFCVNFDFRG